jgi:hypothetical protein
MRNPYQDACRGFAHITFRMIAVALLMWAIAGACQAAGGTTGRRFAVIVGVIHPGAELRCSLADAQLARRMLGGPDENVTLLLSDGSGDGLPTKENILKAIRKRAAQAGKGDSFWFYYSGHGCACKGRSQILPLDFESGAGETGNAIFIEDIRQMMQSESKADTKVVVIDACQSGSEKAYPIPTLEQTFGSVPGVITLAACKVDESSWEFPRLGYSVFTFFLARGLASQDPNQPGRPSTVGSLYQYVCRNINTYITDFTSGTGRAQTPVFLPESAKDAPLGLANPTFVQSLPEPSHGDARPMKPLPPGVVVMVRSEGRDSTMALCAETALRSNLKLHGYPIVARERAAAYENHLNSGDTVEAAQQASRLMSRFLLRARVDSSANEMRFGSERVFRGTATVTIEVIDSDGKVCATASSDGADGSPFIASAFSEGLALRRAVTGATNAASERAISQMETAVKPRLQTAGD